MAIQSIEALAIPVLRVDPATGVDSRELLRMGGQALRGLADRLESGRSATGEPMSSVCAGFWLFIQASDLHGLLKGAETAMPPEALLLALRLVWAGRRCFGDPLEREPRALLVERLETMAAELETMFQRPEKPFPPSPVDFKRLLQKLVASVRDGARYLRSGVGDAGIALTPENVGGVLAALAESARSKEMSALYAHSFLTQYVQIMGTLGQLANIALLLHPDEVYTIQDEEERPPEEPRAARPYAVVTPTYGLGSLQDDPQGCPCLGAGLGGLDLNRQDRGVVPFADIRLLSLFLESGGRLRLLVYLRSQTRPLLVEAERIRFSDFPGVPGDGLTASLRKLLIHLVERCPALTLDQVTADFLRGGPTPDLPRDRLSVATALATILRGGEETGAAPAGGGSPLAPAPVGSAGVEAPGIVCPKCGAANQREPTCGGCGIVFALLKLQAIGLALGADPAAA